jgi:hypothetical protein
MLDPHSGLFSHPAKSDIIVDFFCDLCRWLLDQRIETFKE